MSYKVSSVKPYHVLPLTTCVSALTISEVQRFLFVSFNENIFTYDEFLPSSETDRPMILPDLVNDSAGSSTEILTLSSVSLKLPQTSSAIIPENVRLLPMGQQRKGN
ncbi:hypothetical protein AVEN_28594-1 [Araneus ventricosus]|uniref:Uncharacterized protein n=1 Tax=Araneus ventricosus TaxID=182803 RepID=A0A4Y2DFR0_ARAVE|nr:hypothetical protein AVEN_28594-1 [Araneus ventricosus]